MCSVTDCFVGVCVSLIQLRCVRSEWCICIQTPSRSHRTLRTAFTTSKTLIQEIAPITSLVTYLQFLIQVCFSTDRQSRNSCRPTPTELYCVSKIIHPTTNDNFNSSCPISVFFGTNITGYAINRWFNFSRHLFNAPALPGKSLGS